MAENKTKGTDSESLPQYLFVRNLARDPESRTARRLRPGNSLGFILSDGRRVRRAGGRPIQLDMREVKEHALALAEGVKFKYIEVTDPAGHVIPAEAFLDLIGAPTLNQDSALLEELNRVRHKLSEATQESWASLSAKFMELAEKSGMDMVDAEILLMTAKDQVDLQHPPKTQVIEEKKTQVIDEKSVGESREPSGSSETSKVEYSESKSSKVKLGRR
jgi:hypothetical protein